ncbi:MAG TPA: tyrosine-type recombinase/integrase [Candidatus Scybalomonas excrementigallinarum]|nr:tyrosine-type recombinase/integrase [Candidatus Scybalomonas excrementigallinarum]
MKKDINIKYLNQKQLKKLFKEMREYTLIMELTNERSYKVALRNEALFHLMYYCALRVSETTNILLTSINMDRKEIFCERNKNGLNNTLKIIDPYTLKVLKKHIRVNNPEKYLFENCGHPISRKTVDVWIKFYFNLAKIPSNLAHSHTLRHTRAINLAESGCDLKDLQYWLGHRDIKNTLIYFQFTSKQKNELYKKLKKARKS